MHIRYPPVVYKNNEGARSVIQDKYMFECIFLENAICFVDPAKRVLGDDALLQRDTLFQEKFPDMHIRRVNTEDWESLRKRHEDNRKRFSFDLQNSELVELKAERLFTNAYGYPVLIGENMQLQDGIYEITDLRIIRYAGLIASYISGGETKKVNVGSMSWNTEKQCWSR